MAWIELHDTLPDHKKVIQAADELKMDKDMLVGKLVRLWTWAVNNRENGAFTAREVKTIAEVMRFRGKVQRLIGALVSAGLLDEAQETYTIHDWHERVGMLMAKRETQRAQARERKRRQRARQKESSCAPMGDVTGDSHAGHSVTKHKPNINQAVEDEDAPSAQETYASSFGSEPTPEEVKALERLESQYSQALVTSAIKRAALYGADSPVAYTQATLQRWADMDITGKDELVHYDFLCDALKGSVPSSIMSKEEAKNELRNKAWKQSAREQIEK